MDYPVLCSASVRDQNGIELTIRLIHSDDTPADGSPYKVVLSDGEPIWSLTYEPDYEEFEEVFTTAIENRGGTFIELLD